jgi:hypothetical protein
MPPYAGAEGRKRTEARGVLAPGLGIQRGAAKLWAARIYSLGGGPRFASNQRDESQLLAISSASVVFGHAARHGRSCARDTSRARCWLDIAVSRVGGIARDCRSTLEPR